MSLHGAKGTGGWIDDFGFEPPTKHLSTFSGYRGQDRVHFANPILYTGDELHQMVMWCIDTFGKPSNFNSKEKTWDYQQSPDYFFWFYEEKYLTLFILRWS